MIKFIFIAILTIACAGCSKTIYIVRHAEKDTTIKNDPPLTTEGTQRANDLADLLKNKKVHAVYSTNTLRTTNTAAPTAAYHHITTQLYKSDTDSVKKVMQHIFTGKQNALVVGHSNTILPLLQTIGIQPDKKDVPDWEYDNLFVVKYKRYCYDCANPFVIKKVEYKKYGAASKPTSTETGMK